MDGNIVGDGQDCDERACHMWTLVVFRGLVSTSERLMATCQCGDTFSTLDTGREDDDSSQL